jgi:hypothetical protein
MTSAHSTRTKMTLHFKVKDFSGWPTSYQADDKGRASAGITNAANTSGVK